ncbi:hypothetical protein IF2G_09485 [Cordyceps javanica]|nr:hypothetical protein IF2G_09485 [Cordyceps javanica]
MNGRNMSLARCKRKHVLFIEPNSFVKDARFHACFIIGFMRASLLGLCCGSCASAFITTTAPSHSRYIEK